MANIRKQKPQSINASRFLIYDPGDNQRRK